MRCGRIKALLHGCHSAHVATGSEKQFLLLEAICLVLTTLECEDSAWGDRCCGSCPPPQAAPEAACLLFTAWRLLLPLGFWACGLLAHRSKPRWNGAGCSECQDECPEDGGMVHPGPTLGAYICLSLQPQGDLMPFSGHRGQPPRPTYT